MIETCVSRMPGCCDAIADGEEQTSCIVADNISNNLIVSNHQAGSVGRAILDDLGYDWRILQVTCSLYENIKPKGIAEVTDKRHGTYRARVKKFSIRIQQSVGDSYSARSLVELKKVKTT